MNKAIFKRKTVWLTVIAVIQLFVVATWSVSASALSSGPWKFAVMCDTRGDSNPLNLDKSGVHEAVVRQFEHKFRAEPEVLRADRRAEP